MGDEPHPAYIWVLRLHGTTSVAMLLVLGYLLRDHILPSFKIGKHLKSGLFLACYFLLIVLTVPPLMYLTNQSLKTLAENIHTYVGLTLIAPFIIHILLKNLRQFTPANQE